jgi:rhamnogalacturonyl hydrolase YesR
LRGLSEVLLCLPRESATYREVREVVLEVAEVLVQRQDHEGFWHALLQLPHAESPVESSGTGLLAWHLNLLVKAGHLPDAPFGEAARRAAHALQQCVAENGAPLYACPGPGPLVDDTAYRGPGPFPPGEAHGVFSVLLGLLAGSE